jgi:hypothetical protein
MTHLSPRAIEAGAKTPEQIAAEIVNGLSFTSNRLLDGRLVGEQYFAAQAIVSAIRAERERLQPEGYVLMPAEPTPEIIRAYIAADRRRKRYAATAKRDYRAMLQAAQGDDDAGQ